MSIFEKHRFVIYNKGQHPYRHSLAEFSFINPALPGVSNVEAALNYILAVLYPNTEPAVDTPADLPLAGNTINDYRVVLDDGDGKQASYRWEQREGDASPKWYKIQDMDWSNDSILASLIDVTQPLYVSKDGRDDLDSDGNAITGLYAGQTVYGGKSANTNLTLQANSGDGTGAQTGFVQTDGNFRPTLDDTYDLATASESFRNGYFSNSITVGTLLMGPGSISDTSGSISFGDENLATTGNINGGVVTGTSLVANDLTNTMTLVPGSITDSTGAVTFGVSNLLTTGTLGAGVTTLTNNSETLIFDPDVSGNASITSSLGTISFGDEDLVTTGGINATSLTAGIIDIDNLRIDGNTISSRDVNGNVNITPAGTGILNVGKTMAALDAGFTGTVGITGNLNVDDLQIDSSTLRNTAVNGSLILEANGTGVVTVNKSLLATSDAALDLGNASTRFQDLYISGGLNDGTTGVSISQLLSFRVSNFRDLGATQAAQTGDSLFYDAANGIWLASVPDSEITHGDLSGVTTGDAGHTQFAMLAGRTSGQTILGGTGASENLILGSTSDATKGLVQFQDTLAPVTNAAFGASWSGTDLGSASLNFNDIYSKGEHKGLRLENILASSLPAFSGQSPGRMYYASDVGKVMVDTGAKLKTVSICKYAIDSVWSGSELTKDIDVSAEITDARNAMFQLLDNSDNFKTMGVAISRISATTVRIEANAPLAAGSYRLIGIE